MFNRRTEFSVIRIMKGTLPAFMIPAVLIYTLHCRTGSKTESAEVPSPLTCVKTLDEAGKLTGFTPRVPASILIRVVSRKVIAINKTTVSVIFSGRTGNEMVCRMSISKGDVSGNYNS